MIGGTPSILHFNLSYSDGKVKIVSSREEVDLLSGHGVYRDTYSFQGESLYIFYDDVVTPLVPDTVIFSAGLLTYRAHYLTNSFYSTRADFSYSRTINPFYNKDNQSFAPLFLSKNFSFNDGGLGEVTGYLFDPTPAKMVDHIACTAPGLPGQPIVGTITHNYTVNADGRPATDQMIQILAYAPYGPGGFAPDTLRLNSSFEYSTVAVKR